MITRAMRRSDLDRVMQIENAGYAFPWTRGIFEDCLQMGYPAWVVLDAAGEQLGHAVISMAVGEAHILNLCIAPAHQRKGLGRALLAFVLDHADGEAAIRALLEVRSSNHAALALYESFGFSRIGMRKAYYPAADGREDAVVLMREF